MQAMISSFALRVPGLPSRITAFVRAMHPVPRALCAAALLCGVVALAAIHGGWLRALPETAALPEGNAPASPRPTRAAAADADRTQVRRRCDNCGVVESIRRIEPVGDVPGSYEFTVRLRDGSARTSSDTNASRWRAGDRVMLIGGDAAND